jgi:hypothetical protein
MQNATHGTLCLQHDFWTGTRTKVRTHNIGAVRSLARVVGSLAKRSNKLINIHR